MADHEQMRLDAILNEYNFVSGLIPMYREVEARALSTVGLVLAGLASVVAALMASEAHDRHVEGAIVSIAAWIFALFGSVQLTAQLRILRASRYLQRYVYPELEKLAGPDVMQFERIKSDQLLDIPSEGRTMLQRLQRRLVTSAANSAGLGLLGFAMPFLGAFAISRVSLEQVPGLWWFWVGLVGGALSLTLGIIGVELSLDVERSKKKNVER